MATPGETKRRRASAWVAILLLSILITVGIVLLSLPQGRSSHEISRELTRDFGIACIVAGLVTAIYELYARSRYDFEKVKSLLETVYGSGVPDAVWRSVTSNVLSRNRLRTNACFRLRVVRDEPVDSGLVILEVDFEYDLANLTAKTLEAQEITHRLDDHIASGTDLPRFIELSIGTHTEAINKASGWEASDKRAKVQNGCLVLKTKLEPSGAPPLHVRVRRREVRQCPGSYYLLSDELTDGFKVYLDACVPEVLVTLSIRPTKEDIVLNTTPVVADDVPFLPGHAIEFKLLNAKPA